MDCFCSCNGDFLYIFAWRKVSHISIHSRTFALTDFAFTVVLIWRLYVLYNQSKLILYVLLGFFLPVVALYIAMDIFLWSRPSAMSGESLFCLGSLQANAWLHSARNNNHSKYEVLPSFSPYRTYACDICFHPRHMLRYSLGCSRHCRPQEAPERTQGT
jgi:hypothetical protein